MQGKKTQGEISAVDTQLQCEWQPAGEGRSWFPHGQPPSGSCAPGAFVSHRAAMGHRITGSSRLETTFKIKSTFKIKIKSNHQADLLRPTAAPHPHISQMPPGKGIPPLPGQPILMLSQVLRSKETCTLHLIWKLGLIKLNAKSEHPNQHSPILLTGSIFLWHFPVWFNWPLHWPRTSLSLSRPGVVPPVLEPTGDTASSRPGGGMEAGAGCHGVLAGLRNRHKHTNFMLLPEAISSRTVSNAGKYPVGHYVSDSSSGMKAATFISLSRINRT